MMSKVRTVVNEIEFENEVAEKVSLIQQMKDTMIAFLENPCILFRYLSNFQTLRLIVTLLGIYYNLGVQGAQTDFNWFIYC